MTVHELIKLAELHKDGPKLAAITEYPDLYEVCYVGENGEVLDISSTMSIMKDTGEIGSFFPPDFSEEYLDSGVDIPIPQEYYDNGIAIHVPDDEDEE